MPSAPKFKSANNSTPVLPNKSEASRAFTAGSSTFDIASATSTKRVDCPLRLPDASFMRRQDFQTRLLEVLYHPRLCRH